MKVTCNIIIDFNDNKKVKTVLKSIEVDNLNFIKANTNGKNLEAFIESSSISSLLHTIDDYLACVTIAEKVVDKN